jgi:integrase
MSVLKFAPDRVTVAVMTTETEALITSHGARHTKGSTLSALGASQKVIGASLGHASLESTARYVHAQLDADAVYVAARWASWGSRG